MQLYKLGDIAEKKAALKALGVEQGGVSIIHKKMSLYYFMIKDLRTPAVNILKQDALSIGAELAVPSGAITCEKETFDCLLIGNQKQIEILSRKELAQPFGLKAVAEALSPGIFEPPSLPKILRSWVSLMPMMTVFMPAAGLWHLEHWRVSKR